jgi:hypothetical protein
MVRAVSVAALLSLGLVFACSGTTVGGEGGEGGDASTPPTPKPSPQKQCETYASTWCNRAFTCYVQVGRIQQSAFQRNMDNCTKVVRDSLPCSAVEATGSGYDACLQGIKAMDCAKWDVPASQIGQIVPPSSCDEALIIPG